MAKPPLVADSWLERLRRRQWPLAPPRVRPPHGLGAVRPAEELSAGPEAEAQLAADADALRNIIEGLDRLERGLDAADFVPAAVARGYFCPDEDDRIRQSMLAYRNYRLAAYEIIFRYRHYRDLDEPSVRLRGFVLAYAASLVLMAKSLRVIEWAEHVPLLRAALNAPDEAWGLPAGLFDDVLAGFASLRNYRKLGEAEWFWRWHAHTASKHGLTSAEGWRERLQFIRRQRRIVRRRFARVMWLRLRRDWRDIRRLVRLPFRKARRGVEAFIAERMAAANAVAAASASVLQDAIAQLGSELRTGDILLTRTERGAAAAFVPGFWIHAAIYLRSRGDLEALGVHESPAVGSRWRELPLDGPPHGTVVEAMMPRVRIAPLEQCLAADHVVVIRPAVAGRELGAAICAALAQLGKPYDLEFDFTTDSRIVCTELVYRGFHGRGAIAFDLTKRLGRYTLTGDDIMDAALAGQGAASAEPGARLAVPLLVLSRDGKPNIQRGAEAFALCARIRDGWRPGAGMTAGAAPA